MAYDLEEQEQIAGLKAFWNQYGNAILAVLTVVLLAIAGYRGWGWYQSRQAAQAAVVYEQLRAAADRNDVPKVKETAGTLFESHGGTVYAQMAALVAAKVHFDAGDLKAAKAPLQWALDKSPDEEFRQVARLRLAGILLDEKSAEEGLKLLPADPSGRFAGEIADRRGDLLLALDRKDEARAAYRLALDKLDETSPLRRVIELKHDALGGARE